MNSKVAYQRLSVRKYAVFLRRQFPVLLVWLGAAIVIGLVGHIFITRMIDQDAKTVDAAARNQSAALARGYADHLTRTLEAVDQAILHVRYEWELSNRQLLLENASQRKLFPSNSVFFIAIVNREGVIVTSTIPETEKINVTDQPYFKVHQRATGDELYFSVPTARATRVGANILQFSRKLNTTEGIFDGVVLVALAPGYLTANYDETTLKNEGLLGIVGSDQRVRVTRIGTRVQAVSDPAFKAIPEFQTVGGSELLSGAHWFSDGRSRYIGWHAVIGYPISAVVGLDHEQVFTPHIELRRSLIRTERVGVILLTLCTLTAIVFALRLGWRKQELDSTRTAYRTATEAGKAGFYIAREIRDPMTDTTDFEITDCNEHGAQLFRETRNTLIGTSLSKNGIGNALPGLDVLMQKAKEEGCAEAELEVSNHTDSAASWIQAYVARANEEIAVTLHDISDAKAHLAELEQLSNEDILTGLPNRRWMQTFLAALTGKPHQGAPTFAVLYVDLDGFKDVNDSLGHSTGDKLLHEVAQRLKGAIRPQDRIARVGGDEFVIVLDRLVFENDAALVSENILSAFTRKFCLSADVSYAIGASIGISFYPRDGNNGETLLNHADIAMYAVKTSRKGGYGFFDAKFHDAMLRRLKMEAELRTAIEHDELVMYYQPRVDLATETISSMESLVRWQHPTRGTVPPNEFMPLAEETGLVVHLGTLIIDKVCAQIALWKKAAHPVVPISINVSPRQFTETDVPGLFSSALRRHGISAELVEIEVTESSMMGDTEQIQVAFTRLRQMGIKLFVDDFGTGYSSLSQLQRMAFDGVKVDRAFTSQIDCSEEGNVFVRAIITMAHALGMKVVAEGVENERQVAMLKGLQCDEIQGYFISKPQPPIERQPAFPKYEFKAVL